jgi:hypothetical protein
MASSTRSMFPPPIPALLTSLRKLTQSNNVHWLHSQTPSLARRAFFPAGSGSSKARYGIVVQSIPATVLGTEMALLMRWYYLRELVISQQLNL